MKNKFIVFITLVLITLGLTVSISNIKADSGFDYSYDSGSDSYYDSGSSYDYSYSSDDDDYSGSGTSTDTEENFIAMCVIFSAMIVFTIVFNIKSNIYETRVRNKINPINSKIIGVNDSNLNSLIPGFNRQQFLDKVYHMYILIQQAWMNFELQNVRNMLTDELYNMYLSQLKTLEIKGQKNIMGNFELQNMDIVDITKANNRLEIKVQMKIKQCDYIIDVSNEKVLRGNSRKPALVLYELTFVKSIVDSNIKFCPTCGANIDINSSTTCEYCHNVIVDVENKNWVLSKKNVIAQKI